MLRKLMKYEIIATSRFFPLMYGALIVLSFINSSLFNVHRSGLNVSFNEDNFLYSMVSFFSVLLYAGIICGIFVGNTFSMISRYYKNMLGDEGYLMNTLPVKSWQHITAKAVVSGMWMFFSIIVTIISVSILAWEFPDIPRAIGELAGDITRSGGSAALVFTEIILMILLGLLGYMLPFYAAISIGQFWKKHRVLGAVLAYIGISAFTQVVAGYVLKISTSQNGYISDYAQWHTFAVPIIILSLLGGAACFIISSYALSRKLNLE